MALLHMKTVSNPQTLVDFDTRIRKSPGYDGPPSYTVEPKINGLAVKLVYENGTLTRASTPGDGGLEENVTPNIKTILSVPLTLTQKRNHLPPPDLLEIRGDVYMEKRGFEKLNHERIHHHLSPYDTPENAASDSLKQPDSRITARRRLDMFCYGTGPMERAGLDTQYQLMIQLQKWGLRINRRHLHVYDTIEDVLAYCHQLKQAPDQFFYEIEGAVIKVNPLDVQKKLNQDSKPPEGVMVYRFTGANPAGAEDHG
ncbi:MAG: hypothetical protein R6U38_09360 [Desulfatiglandaceae bacterium]